MAVLQPGVSVAILYVDDHEARAHVQSAWLREAGFDVLVAANGTEAKALIEAEHPLAAVVDVHLPDIGGVELARWLKDRDPHIPVILFSSLFRSPHDQFIGFTEGAADFYLTEPLQKTAFLDAVRRFIH
jgi:CheY-like chemotaxis protein